MIDLFKRNKDGSSKQDDDSTTAPGTQIYYHPGLIDELVADHHALITLAGKIKQLYTDGSFDSIPDRLNEFGTLLRSHLLKENIKLYVYLQHVLAVDEENISLMQGFRSEMKGIGRAVTGFLHKYNDPDWNIELRTSFGDEFNRILEILGKRIKMEETVLYTLYLPPDAYR